MATERSNDDPVLVLQPDEPLIGIVTRLDGDQYVERIFAGDDESDAEVDDDVIRSALALAGAWNDLDWDDMVEALDRIRHSNPPSPPLEV